MKIVSLSLIILFLNQYLISTVTDTLLWPVNNIEAFSISLLFVISLLLFTFSLTRSLFFSFILNLFVFFIEGVISFSKKNILGYPLFPYDLSSYKEATEMFIKLISIKSFIYSLVIAFCFFTTSFFLKRKEFFNINISLNKRIFYGFFSSLVLSFLILANNPIHDFLFYNYFSFKNGFSNKEFERKGFLISFLSLIERGAAIPPENYSEEKVEKILSLYKEDNKEKIKIKPDVIVIMSESLFDPLNLKEVEWKEDPLKYTRTLSKNLSLTRVSTFGGKTANSEFEFLTGFNMNFFGQGSVPYELLKNNTKFPSILDNFKQEGYKTTAIHPGRKTFWNRDQIYKSMGFDKFISEDDFKNKKIYGNYIADENIIGELKDNLSDSPSFNFVVTLQNHMPYQIDPFDFKNILFDSKNLDIGQRVVLNYYSKLVKETDRFHKKLIKMLKKRKRPTLLIIFGDHLPPLDKKLDLFVKQKMISSPNRDDWSVEEENRMFRTPLITWSNFGFKSEDKVIDLNFLGIKLIKELNFKLSPTQNYIYSLYKESNSIKSLDKNMINNRLLKKIRDYQAVQFKNLTSFL